MSNTNFKSKFCSVCGIAIVVFGIGAAATLHKCQAKRQVYFQLDNNGKACLLANFKSADPSPTSLTTVSGYTGTVQQTITPPIDVFEAAKGINDLILYVDPSDLRLIDSVEYTA